MRSEIKFGVCQWAIAARINGPYGFKILSEMGLDGIELELGKYEEGFPLSNKKIQDAYLDASKEYDFELSSIAVNELNNYGMTNPEGSRENKIALTAIHKAIDAAEALGISIVQLPSFENGEIKEEEGFQNTVFCLKDACSYAEEKGITIGTENLLTTEENLRILDEVDFDNLKVYFDLQNYHLFKGYDTPKMLDELMPHICEIHAKDGDGHLSGSLLGTGKAKFHNSIKILKEKGYSGWIQLENYYFQEPLSLEDESFNLLKKDIKILKEALTK